MSQIFPVPHVLPLAAVLGLPVSLHEGVVPVQLVVPSLHGLAVRAHGAPATHTLPLSAPASAMPLSCAPPSVAPASAAPLSTGPVPESSAGPESTLLAAESVPVSLPIDTSGAASEEVASVSPASPPPGAPVLLLLLLQALVPRAPRETMNSEDQRRLRVISFLRDAV